MSEQKPKVLLKPTYLKMIENAIGSSIFNSLYIEDQDGNSKDVLNDGEFSCAIFTSAVLVFQTLLPKVRATAKNLEIELSESDLFKEVDEKEIEPGDIIFWKKFKFEDGSENGHVGFYYGDEEAVSTSYLEKKIIKHHYKNFSKGERKIEKVYRINWEKFA